MALLPNLDSLLLPPGPWDGGEEGWCERGEGHMDETRGSLTRGSCVPEEGSPFSDGAHRQPAGGLALGPCDCRERAVGTAGVFISELKGGGGMRCMCWRRKSRCD